MTFSDISENFYNLEDSWTAIGDYLPESLSFDNVANLAFSQDGDDFFIFNGDSSSDDYGVMLAEVNVWQRTGEYEILWYDYVEYDYNYNFRDPG